MVERKRAAEPVLPNTNAHYLTCHARYEASMRALLDVTLAMQGGQWEEAMDLYSVAKSSWQELRASHDLRRDKSA